VSDSDESDGGAGRVGARRERRRTERRASADDRRFWRALVTERRLDERRHIDVGAPMPPAPQPIDTQRRDRLRAMLQRAEQRQQAGQARRAERHVFAEGVPVNVLEGAHRGRQGTLLDADYIHARGLIVLDDSPEPVWIDFRALRSRPAPPDA